MPVGTVKSYDDSKGFGYITPEDGGEDIFVHSSSINYNGGFKTIMEGQKVHYDIKQGPKGKQAINVGPP